MADITATVKPVMEGGLTLDEQATPQQIVYAMLQVLKDDVRAGDDAARRRGAFERALHLAAPTEIVARFHRAGEAREETLRRVVRLWAPVVSYYVDAFDAPMETLTGAMRVAPLESRRGNKSTAELQRVTLTVMDPGAPGETSQRAVLRVDVARESGIWRVCYVGFADRPIAPKMEASDPVAPAESKTETTSTKEQL